MVLIEKHPQNGRTSNAWGFRLSICDTNGQKAWIEQRYGWWQLLASWLVIFHTSCTVMGHSPTPEEGVETSGWWKMSNRIWQLDKNHPIDETEFSFSNHLYKQIGRPWSVYHLNHLTVGTFQQSKKIKSVEQTQNIDGEGIHWRIGGRPQTIRQWGGSLW